jgi:hypothetical protein
MRSRGLLAITLPFRRTRRNNNSRSASDQILLGLPLRTAFLLWTYEGTNTGPGGSGNRVRFSGWEAWTFSPSGLVQRSIGTFDRDEYERQLANGI